jgi:hypothetical protein
VIRKPQASDSYVTGLPGAAATAGAPGSVTFTGSALASTPPLPSTPSSLSPQQYTSPDAVSAHATSPRSAI